MKAKNQQERDNSLLKFLGMFMGTVLLVVLAVVIGVSVPTKQNMKLKDDVRKCKDAAVKNAQLNASIDSVSKWLSSLNDPTTFNRILVQEKISKKIIAIDEFAQDSIGANRFIKIIAGNFQNTLRDKGDISQLTNELAVCKKSLEVAKHDLDLANTQLATCNTALNAYKLAH